MATGVFKCDDIETLMIDATAVKKVYCNNKQVTL